MLAVRWSAVSPLLYVATVLLVAQLEGTVAPRCGEWKAPNFNRKISCSEPRVDTCRLIAAPKYE